MIHLMKIRTNWKRYAAVVALALPFLPMYLVIGLVAGVVTLVEETREVWHAR